MSYRSLCSKLVLLALAPVVTTLLHTPTADACDPANWYWDTIPQPQETFPANAKPVLQGYGSFDKVTATIDGVDATVSVNTELSKLFVGVAVDLDPQPQPGQTVVIHYPGETGCEMEDPCPDQLTYIAGALDEVAPATATIDEVNVVRHNFENFDSCGGIDGGLTWWLNMSHEPDATSAPEYLRITASNSDNKDSIIATDTRSSGAQKAEINLELAAADNLPALPSALCFRIQVLDLAGQVSTVQEGVCDVCHFRDDEPTDNGEPQWTDDDIFPGGACGEGPGTDSDSDSDSGETDSGTETTGETEATGETENPSGSETENPSGSETENPSGSETDASTTDGQDDEGCGCRSSQDAPAAWWLALLVGFGLRRRR